VENVSVPVQVAQVVFMMQTQKSGCGVVEEITISATVRVFQVYVGTR